jgi:hypothetical protein
MAVLKVRTDIITSIIVIPVGRAVILVIMYVEIFKMDVIVFFGIKCHLTSRWPIVSIIQVAKLILTISLSELSWYWQYHSVRSKVDTDNITQWDQRLILTISLSEIKVDTDNITQWDQSWYWHITQWDQRLILTISLSEIKGWYWQYYSVRSKVDTDNITQWDQRKNIQFTWILNPSVRSWYTQFFV